MKRWLLATAGLLLAASCTTLNAANDQASEASVEAAEASWKKNLSGTWRVMNRGNYDLEAHPARHAMQLREGPWGPLPAKSVVKLGAVGSVPAGPSMLKGDGKIPYLPEAEAQRDENRANWIDRDPEVKCYLPGVPRATYMDFPFKVIQNDEQTLFVYEYANTVRNIYMEDPGEAPVDSWMGQSYGYWEDDTFVVEVTAQNGQTWFDRSGNFMSALGKVTERYTPIDAHHIRYEATIEDEETFSEPWTIEMTLYRLVGEDAELQEFNCVEFVEEMLYGHLRKEPLQ